MDDAEFRTVADRALEDLFRKLTKAADQHDFETDFNAGTLAIEFEDPPAKFVISPNTPVRQIWVSAQMRSFKLDWDPKQNAFVLDRQTLADLISKAVSEQLGEEVIL